MNLSQLESDLYRRLGYKVIPDIAVVTRLRAYLNQTQREILSQKGLASLRRMPLPFVSVANSPYAVLPQAAVRILTVVDRTNRFELSVLSQDDLRLTDPGQTDLSATPSGYAVLNLSSAVAAQPAAACELFAISDSATDGATKEVFVEGIVTGGYPRSASVALNGITAVSLGATITRRTDVTKFYVTLAAGGLATAAGNITLRAVSGIGAELSRITPGRSYPRYTRIQLFPTPSAALTYHADVELHIEDMVESNDEPYLPEDFHWVLGSGALMKEYQRMEKQVQYAEEKAMYRTGIGDLKVFVARAVASSRDSRDYPRRRYSQLGSYFSSGS